MKKYFLPVLSMLVLLGCQGIFQSNLYDSIDKRDYSSPQDLSLNELLVAMADEDFYDQLAQEETQVVEQIINDLQSIMDNPDSSAENAMEAAVVQCNIIMELSTAASAVNNINQLVEDILIDQSTVTLDSPSDLFFQLMDSDDPQVLENQVNGLLLTAQSLESYGSLLGSQGEIPNSVDPDELGTIAFLSGMMQVLADPDGDGSLDNSPEEIVAFIQSGDVNDLNSNPQLDLFSDGGDGDLTKEDMTQNLVNTFGADLFLVIYSSTLGDLLIEGTAADLFGA
ncbi:MAG: hypothetical protein PF447_14030 [Spirochaetaceae bacterium]|jgi:hypothetical protein|nr:hypothetical protein [Spirochaetaceae bacterium]